MPLQNLMGRVNFTINQIIKLIRHCDSYKTVERPSKDLYIKHYKLTYPVSANDKTGQSDFSRFSKKKN